MNFDVPFEWNTRPTQFNVETQLATARSASASLTAFLLYRNGFPSGSQTMGVDEFHMNEARHLASCPVCRYLRGLNVPVSNENPLPPNSDRAPEPGLVTVGARC